MIKDLILNKEYEGRSCRFCKSDNVYIIHCVNKKYPDDPNKDHVYCRCSDCKTTVIKDDSKVENKDRYFENNQDAIEAWNEGNK